MLTDTVSGKVLFDDTYFFSWSNFSSQYNDPALNAVVTQLPVGSYNLKVSVKAGPITDPATLATPETTVLDQDFDVAQNRIDIAADRTIAHQGETVVVSLTAGMAGITSLNAGVQYDAQRFTLDEEATRAANPGLDVSVNALASTVTVQGGTSAAAGQALAKLHFTAIRTAADPVTGENAPQFVINEAEVGVNGGALGEAYSKGLSVSVEVGYNVEIRKNFLSGYDLLLIYTASAATYTYVDTPLYDVSFAGYLADGAGYPCTYAYLAPNASANRLTVGTTAGTSLNWGLDTNMSGQVDLADAQQVVNVITGKVTPGADMARCLAADVNKDGVVDGQDVSAILRAVR